MFKDAIFHIKHRNKHVKIQYLLHDNAIKLLVFNALAFKIKISIIHPTIESNTSVMCYICMFNDTPVIIKGYFY